MYRIMLVDDETNILSALKRALLTIPIDDLDGDGPEIETSTSAGEAPSRLPSRNSRASSGSSSIGCCLACGKAGSGVPGSCTI